jgi:hypothetical protein
MGNKSIALVGAVIVVVAIAFSMSGALKGRLLSTAWNEKSELLCGGNQHITIRDRHIKMEQGPVFSVGGHCELEVIDSDIVAPSVLSGGGSAHVVFRGGSITASDSAISVGGSAQVEISGTKIVGAVNKGGSARITGLPDLDRQQAADDAQKALDDKWGRTACDGLAECYRSSGFAGQAAARVVGILDASGAVTQVEISGTPGAQRGCLESAMKAKKVSAFDGGSGKLVCEFAGTWAAGNETLDIGGGFRR